MTPTDDATFIQLWHAGLATAEIARRLGIKATTAQSRAHRLQQRGLIQPRPRGGNYPTRRAKGREPGEGGPSTVHPATEDRPPSTVHPDTWELQPLKHSVRWTIYVPLALQEEIKHRAAARGQHPSIVLQELLWKALHEHSASTPERSPTGGRTP